MANSIFIFHPFKIFILCTWLVLQIDAQNLMQRSTYIVHMDKTHMPNVYPTHHHWYSSTVDSLKPDESLLSNSRDQSSPSIIYSYSHVLHGFTALLSEEELQTLKSHPAFVSAYADRTATVDTTYSPEFLSLSPKSGLLKAGVSGDDVIIGVIDSGVWPESRSYDDYGLGPVPTRWKGICESGEGFDSSMCNRKLIGARYFNRGLKATLPRGTRIRMNSARDIDGHGTHTSSTVAGAYVSGANYSGYAMGTARGVAPHARLAIYKVIWKEGRKSSDVLAAVDQAIADGVDVLSMSLGFDDVSLFEDPVAIGSFAAMEKGVFVSTSAGNNVPLHNGIPWALTVAAGSVDRTFSGTLTLGNGHSIMGWTLFPARALVEKLPLIYDKKLSLCKSAMELANKVQDGIIICDDVGSTNSQMQMVAESGVSAAIFISDDPIVYEVGGSQWPSVVVSSRDGQLVIDYAQSARMPWGSIEFQQTFVKSTRAPNVGFYSSRGPARSYPGILKPDLMAPGTQILAAYPPIVDSGKIGPGPGIPISSEFALLSGTSMATPHASGVAALLKAAHPKWTPAAIRSAMMTTANPIDNTGRPIRDSGEDLQPASPLAMGSGQIDPNRALDPGLIYDTTPEDYINLLCSMELTRNQILTITRSNNYNCTNPSSDLNYPSFISFYNHRITKTKVQKFYRTLTNVGEGPTSYIAKWTTPKGVKVRVDPQRLVFGNKFGKQSYTMTIKFKGDERKRVMFGSLVWVEENGRHKVRSPIVVSPPLPPVEE